MAQLEAEKQRLAEGIERQRAATEADRLRQLAEMEQLRAEQQRQQDQWARQQADLLAQQQVWLNWVRLGWVLRLEFIRWGSLAGTGVGRGSLGP